MFLGSPDPNPIVRDVDPDPDPSIVMQNSKENIDSYSFLTFSGLFILNDVKDLQKVINFI
jgi:hypothetical protein